MKDNKEDKPKVRVEVEDWGPLKISGNFILKDLQRNNESTPGEVLLCRCGKTLTQPYCDGSHKK
jgi:CDGSH-type Zn-finger protein